GPELYNGLGGRYSVEHRFPFQDRRLIEFALALPESQRWRGLETKYVLRHACRGLLPQSVRLRQTKGDFSYLFAALIAREAEKTFRSLRLAEDGFVNGRQAQRVYDRYLAGSR